jgi:hypothetical protein
VRKGPNGEPGWTAVIDPDLATASTIAYAGQMLGIRFDAGSSLDTQRNLLKDAAGIYRGTPKAIAGAVQNLGVNNVLIYERSASNYTFAVGVFTAETYARYVGFETDDEVTGWVDATFSHSRSSRIIGADPAAGASFASLLYDQGASNRMRKLMLKTVTSGETVTATFKLRVPLGSPSASVHIQLGDPGASEFSAYDPPLIAAGDDWEEFSIGYSPGSGSECWLLLTNRTTDTISLEVDDLVITSDDLVTTGMIEPVVSAAVKTQKPLGMLFTSLLVDPTDWTWFVIGSTRFARNVATGFIEEIPTPYPTWQDVVDNFASWQDFIDNIPI